MKGEGLLSADKTSANGSRAMSVIDLNRCDIGDKNSDDAVHEQLVISFRLIAYELRYSTFIVAFVPIDKACFLLALITHRTALTINGHGQRLQLTPCGDKLQRDDNR